MTVNVALLDCLTYGHLANAHSGEFDELLTATVSHHLRMSDLAWLNQWSQLTTFSAIYPQVPVEACFIRTCTLVIFSLEVFSDVLPV